MNKNFFFLLVTLAILASPLQAQTRIRVELASAPSPMATQASSPYDSAAGPMHGPSMGYVSDPSGRRIWPILGIPGAAVFGAPVQTNVSRIELSPLQNYYLAVGTGDRIEQQSQPVLLRSLSNPVAGSARLPGAMPNPARIVLSPGGASAVLVGQSAIQVVSGLPDSPSAARAINLSPSYGSVSATTVNDSGSVVLVVFSKDGTDSLYRFSSGGDSGLIATGAQISGLAISPDGSQAVFIDAGNNSVWLVSDIAGAAPVILLAGENDGIINPVGVAVAAAGDAAIVANEGSASVIKVPFVRGSFISAHCLCVPEMLRPLSPGVFLLNAPSPGPLWILDTTNSHFNIVFVPPPSLAGTQGVPQEVAKQ